MGIPSNSVNCLEGRFFLALEALAGIMRVPNPAAGMIPTTFIAGCKYKGQQRRLSNHSEPTGWQGGVRMKLGPLTCWPWHGLMGDTTVRSSLASAVDFFPQRHLSHRNRALQI